MTAAGIKQIVSPKMQQQSRPYVRFGRKKKEIIGDKCQGELKGDTILLPTRGKVCYTTKDANIQKAEIDSG